MSDRPAGLSAAGTDAAIAVQEGELREASTESLRREDARAAILGETP